MKTRGVTNSLTGANHRSTLIRRHRIGAALCLLALPAGLMFAAPQQDDPAADPQASQAATPVQSAAPAGDRPSDNHGYKPPATSQRLAADAPVRPLLAAVRAAAAAFDARAWPKTSTQEMGISTFSRFDRLFEKERIQRATDGFLEGYSQVFIELPEAIIVTAMQMKDEQAAADYYLMELQTLQISLDGINQSEDGRAEVTLEEDIILTGLDQGFDKRYEVYLGDLPPSRFRVMFGRSGRHAMLLTFLQSDVGDDAARELLRLLAEQVNRLAPPGDAAGR